MSNFYFFFKNSATYCNRKNELKNLFFYFLFLTNFSYSQNNYVNTKGDNTTTNLVYNKAVLASISSGFDVSSSSSFNFLDANGIDTTKNNNVPTLSLNKNIENNASQHRDNELNYFWLNLIGENEQFCQMAVGYRAEATNCVDDYDATRIDGDFTLNSLICSDTNDYVIQGRAMPFNPSDSVPLSIKIATSGNCTIFLDHTLGLFTDPTQPIYLHDLFANTYFNLRLGSYSFYTRFGVFKSRFEISYSAVLSTPINVNNDYDLNVYRNNDDIVVFSEDITMTNIKIFDMLGKLLLEKNSISNNEVHLNIDGFNGVVFLKITLLDGQVVTKKLIK